MSLQYMGLTVQKNKCLDEYNFLAHYANYITGFNRKTILTMSIKKARQADFLIEHIPRPRLISFRLSANL